MPLSVLILGNGSALPTVNTHQTAQILASGNELFLIDCGEGTQVELRRHSVKIQRINHVFISHLHGDHFFGLVGLLSSMHLLGRTNKIHIYGPEGLDEIVQIQFRKGGSKLSFEMEFHAINSAGMVLFENKNLIVETLPLNHRIPCFGFLFKEKIGLRKLKANALKEFDIPKHKRKGITEGEDFINDEGERIPNEKITNAPADPVSYAYCSDTAYSEKLIELIKGIDLLYHESTFLESEKERAKKTFHSTAKQAAQVANLAGVGKLLLGHFSNRYRSKERFLMESRQIFKQSFIAEEGVEFKV